MSHQLSLLVLRHWRGEHGGCRHAWPHAGPTAPCSPGTGAGALPQQTDTALTTSSTMGPVTMQRPHTTMMATLYSGKPGSGGGGSRVSSGAEHSSQHSMQETGLHPTRLQPPTLLWRTGAIYRMPRTSIQQLPCPLQTTLTSCPTPACSRRVSVYISPRLCSGLGHGCYRIVLADHPLQAGHLNS